MHGLKRDMWRRSVIMILCAVIIVLNISTPAPVAGQSKTTPVEYLTHVLDIVEERALFSDQIYWPSLREQALEMIADAQTTADTYPAIRYVLQRLNDAHSQLWTPDVAAANINTPDSGASSLYEAPTGKRLSGSLGYIALPRASVADSNLYVETAYTLLKQITQPPVCGWVVDLRNNRGGSMAPMLAAVGSLLGNGKLGTFIDRHGNNMPWSYKDGGIAWGDTVAFQFTPPNLGMDYSASPVAVLTSSRTASAGEVVTISFSGRKDTKRFGTATAGLTTGNVPYPLSDGAVLLLAETFEADRTGYIFMGRIPPDVVVLETASDNDGDPVLETATEWLSSQCPF